MKISIIIPTYNNIQYLKLLLKSIVNNSIYKHEIIIHVNKGSDGTLNFIKDNKYLYTYSAENIGLCNAVNTAAKLSSTNYILYAHDDMYFCKKWDLLLENEINTYKDNLYYISGTNVSKSNGLINYDCGTSPGNFDENKFNEFCENDRSKDLQGSHWAPHLIHKDIWTKIGGFSEEFNPGDGSDPDLCMKLWNEKIRIFKCLSNFKVYHFGSITTRKREIIKNNGTKKFLLKWGFNPRFFRRFYLRGEGRIPFNGPLTNPKMNSSMIFNLYINKIKFLYHKILN
jgi:glycosyltransferase involved in cell wall biosynthesis